MQAFYDTILDTVYLVPNRNGSSFLRTHVEEHEEFGFGPLNEYLHTIEDYDFSGGMNSPEKVILLLAQMVKDDRFNNTKIVILYRNPLVRYKSGLGMVLHPKGPSTSLDNIKHGTPEWKTLFANQAKWAIRANIEAITPHYCFNDAHTTPTMHISLLIYMLFFDRTTLLHIKDLTSYALKTWGVKSDLVEIMRGKRPEKATPEAEKLWDLICRQNEHFHYTDKYYRDPDVRERIFSFYEYMQPEMVAYNNISHTSRPSYGEAQEAFMMGLQTSERTVVRSGPLYAYYADGLKHLNDGPAKSMLAKHMGNVGNVMTKLIHQRWGKS